MAWKMRQGAGLDAATRSLERLSPASVYTLGVQGGPMRGAELAAFAARPHAADACRVRRWDDLAKDPRGRPPAA